MGTLSDNKAVLEVLKANIFLSQCIITILNNVITDFKLEDTDKQNVYENKILKNLSDLKVLSDSLGSSLQSIIESLELTESDSLQETLQ